MVNSESQMVNGEYEIVISQLPCTIHYLLFTIHHLLFTICCSRAVSAGNCCPQRAKYTHAAFYVCFFSYFRTVTAKDCPNLYYQLILNPTADHNHEQAQELLFSDIFRQHEPRLHTLALRMTKSDQAAKDIIQEVFLKLWEKRDQLCTIHNLDAWLYRLTENKVIDYLRKVAADDRLRETVWQHLQQILNEAELYVAAKEYNQIIQKAINQLPPQRKLIYQLCKEDGMSYEQIASELRVSRHTVKNQLFTAVQSVRDFISRNVKLW